MTSEQVVQALETLGQVYFRLGLYGRSANMYNDIDKIFGERLGDSEKSIKEKRHLGVLLKDVKPQTIDFDAEFTLQKLGEGYPVQAPEEPAISAQLDTGAEISAISDSTAKALQATRLEGTATLYGYGGGAFHAQPGVVPARHRRATLHNVAVFIVPDEQLGDPKTNKHVNALLGYS